MTFLTLAKLMQKQFDDALNTVKIGQCVKSRNIKETKTILVAAISLSQIF